MKKLSDLPIYCYKKGRPHRPIYYFQRNDYRVPLPHPEAPEFRSAYERALAAMPAAGHLSEQAVFKALGMQKNEVDQYFRPIEAGAKQRAKQAGREYTLPPYWGADAYIRQGGKCAVSGLVMRRSEGRFDFQSPSIDRIDSTGGYTPDNCHLVAFGVNVAKGTMGLADFVKLCRAVVAEARRTERERTKKVERPTEIQKSTTARSRS